MASISVLKWPTDDLLKGRIDFTSRGSFQLEERVPEHCKVLQSDKILYGDKSTTGSPISSHRESSAHHDSGSSSGSSFSGSASGSPFSYTQDLVGVDSPGLSGGAGCNVPSKEILPLKYNLDDGLPRNKDVPSGRKSRFDQLPEDVEQERISKELKKMVKEMDGDDDGDKKDKDKKKCDVTGNRSNGVLPNGKRKAEEDTNDEDDDDDDTPIDPRRLGSVGSLVKRIKLETLSTTVVKPTSYSSSTTTTTTSSSISSKTSSLTLSTSSSSTSSALPPLPSPPSLVAPKSSQVKPLSLVPRVLTNARSSPPPSSKNASVSIGPQLPPQSKENGKSSVNGSAVPFSRSSSSSSLTQSSSSSSTTGSSSSISAQKAAGRKRLLSERGEKELSYPVMEKEISNKWEWSGASWMPCEKTFRGIDAKTWAVGEENNRPRGVGLINRSNDCFLNVILQMITHTAPLARYLVERHRVDCKRDEQRCVACALRDNHLTKTFMRNGPMETRWIRPYLAQIFPSHCSGMQEDAHELLTLLLDAIDHPVGYNRQNGNKELPTNKLNPSTPIEQIFGGTLRNQVTCQSCHTPYINYERIRELNLALIRRDDQKVPITALVQDYFKNETLQAFSCKKCARKTQAVRVTRILRAPAVLLVQLKRFNAYGGKIRQPVQAERLLDLSKYTFNANEGFEDPKQTGYTLTGVVEHLGSTVDHGHYVAYAKGLDGGVWYKFDDEDVCKSNIMNANPYLLVYSRTDTQRKSNGQMNGNVMKNTNMMNGRTTTQNSSYSGMPSSSYEPQRQQGYGSQMGGGSKLVNGGGYNGNGGGKLVQGGYGGNKYNNHHHNRPNHYNGGGGNKYGNQNNGMSRPVKVFNGFKPSQHI